MISRLKFAIPLILFTIVHGIWLGSDLPEGMHVWAQSDRYSVAVHYLDELNFLNPRTHSLASEDGKVGVEFPAVQYVVGRIGCLTGESALPGIYRWITGIIFLTGLLVFLAGKDFSDLLKLVLSFLLISPIAFYYQFNFLPDAAALGFLFLAFASFDKFRKHEKPVDFIRILIWCGLAALLKTSVAVYFISFSSLILFWPPSREFDLHKRLLAFGVVILIGSLIAGYDYFYFMKKNRRLWSVVFMSASNPLRNFNDLVSVWKNMRTWRLEYFSLYQYVLMLLLAVWSLKSFKLKLRPHGVSFWFLITAVGVLSFSILIGKQFSNHDYYFLCTFYPLFVWALPELIRIQITRGDLHYTAVLSTLLFLSVVHTIQIAEQAEERRSDLYVAGKKLILNETSWMREAQVQLRLLEIPPASRFFVFYEFGPNTALVQIGHRGMVFNHEEMSRGNAFLNEWFQRLKPEYGLIRRKWTTHFKREQPEFFRRCSVMDERSEYIILKLPEVNGS